MESIIDRTNALYFGNHFADKFERIAHRDQSANDRPLSLTIHYQLYSTDSGV